MPNIIPVIIGMIARIPILFIQGKRLNVRSFKLPILAILFTAFEFVGTMLLYIFENGDFGGMSYYGGILLMPIFGLLLALVFRIKYLDMMDLFATVAGAMVIMRIQCIIEGCCGGKVLFVLNGMEIRFPNRSIEIITVLIITIVILNLGKKEKYQGLLYPIYMISYSTMRFLTNWFRAGVKPFVGFLPAGNFWALIAIIVSVIWIMIVSKRKKALSLRLES